MALIEDIIFSDPVLQRIFFDCRRFAPRSKQSAGEVAGLGMAISDAKVKFMKATTPPLAEYWQRKMRMRWFSSRKLCDGYFIDAPFLMTDGDVEMFARDGRDVANVFNVNKGARAAYWWKYAQRSPPDWGDSTLETRRGRRRGRRRAGRV